uniref:RING-type domain-containing protein n=1 Tax=Timema monikensis TaxID=170555 RepID=A0A7R9ED78_9NEOP|nr:unnamed protein product [Timema monikensis]
MFGFSKLFFQPKSGDTIILNGIRMKQAFKPFSKTEGLTIVCLQQPVTDPDDSGISRPLDHTWRKCTNICVKEEWKTVLGKNCTPEQDSNLNLPIIGCLVSCERTALDSVAIETGAPKGSLSKMATPSLPDVASLLDCIVCFERMRPPIYTCSTGHSVCGPCCQKLQFCPTCRSKFKGGRNFLAEDICEILNSSSPDSQPSMMINHRPHTPIRGTLSIYDCLAVRRIGKVRPPRCHWSGTKHQLEDHVRRFHSRCYRDLNEANGFQKRYIGLGISQEYITLLKAPGALFWEQFHYDCWKRDISHAVKLIWSQERDKQCRVLIEYKSVDGLYDYQTVCNTSNPFKIDRKHLDYLNLGHQQGGKPLGKITFAASDRDRTLLTLSSAASLLRDYCLEFFNTRIAAAGHIITQQ